MKQIAAVLALMLAAGMASADSVSGFTDVTLDSADTSNIVMTHLTWGGVTYEASQFIFGTTERFYNTTAGGTAIWVEGDPVPADIQVVGGSSTPKVGDVASNGDNNVWTASGNNISSLDGLPFQQTMFETPVSEIFIFERGGNDDGTIQPILVGGALGPGLALNGPGDPYANISTFTGGAGEFGYVYQADVPIMGIQINAPGHDAFTVVAVPEPGTLALLGVAGLVLVARRRRR